jgi:hypothetical protein
MHIGPISVYFWPLATLEFLDEYKSLLGDCSTFYYVTAKAQDPLQSLDRLLNILN